jgi:hypothetical protein
MDIIEPDAAPPTVKKLNGGILVPEGKQNTPAFVLLVFPPKRKQLISAVSQGLALYNSTHSLPQATLLVLYKD